MKPSSQSAKAYHEIRHKILSRQLKANTRLKEDEWAAKSGVSRMAVREALNRLYGEQLVSIGPKGGYFITAVQTKDFETIRELREILELGALHLLFKKLNQKKIERLEKICNDFTLMVKEKYFDGACEADIKFHETLIELAENEKLEQAYKTSHIPLFHQQLSKAQTDAGEYEQTDKEHRLILKALKEKNFKKAQEALTKHFERGLSIVLE
jgi:DNA-binding GntR family transcriptional regulator